MKTDRAVVAFVAAVSSDGTYREPTHLRPGELVALRRNWHPLGQCEKPTHLILTACRDQRRRW